MILNIVTPVTRSRVTPALAALAVLAVSPAGAREGARASVLRERVLMGTTLSVEIPEGAAPGEAQAAEAAAAALDEVARLEAVLSTWRPDAEMSRANDAARRGSALLSPELCDALGFALGQARRTRGAFDPAVGALVDAWDLRGAGRIPADDRLAAALRATGHEHVRFDASARTLAFDAPAAWIDTGGFGKGLALDRAAAVLAERGVASALLDFGGQLLALGPGALDVAVADPRDRSRPALTLSLRGASASTSAQSERFVEVGARRFGHVLDPRSGRPVVFTGSATVVAPTAAEADALSTALLVMGPERGLAFANEQGLCAGFLVPRDGLRLQATPSFFALVRGARPGVALPGRTPLLSFSRSSR